MADEQTETYPQALRRIADKVSRTLLSAGTPQAISVYAQQNLTDAITLRELADRIEADGPDSEYESRTWDLGNGKLMRVRLPRKMTAVMLDRLKRYVELLRQEMEIRWESEVAETPEQPSAVA